MLILLSQSALDITLTYRQHLDVYTLERAGTCP